MACVPRIRHSPRVPGRASKLLLAAGIVVVLALAIGLVQMTHGAREAATPIAGSRPVARARAAEPPAASEPSAAAPEPRPSAAAPRRQMTMPGKRPELAPSAPTSIDRELKRDANGNLVPVIPVKELREQLHLTEAPMKACIARAGKRVTGKATLSFTVAARNNKLVIETTGVQDEDTLAQHPELLECMHQTANVFSLEGRAVPELGTSIYVRRHVALENGALAENSIFNFSYNP